MQNVLKTAWQATWKTKATWWLVLWGLLFWGIVVDIAGMVLEGGTIFREGTIGTSPHDQFQCQNCHYRPNDDRIGAMNLHRLGIEYRVTGATAARPPS